MNITSANITETVSGAVISFPRRSTIDRRGIDEACRMSKYYRDPSTVDTACSSSSFSSCRHLQLFDLAQLVNFASLEVKCPECTNIVNLLSFAEQNIHLHHNPRTGTAPPSTSISSCPNPKCSDIPFPHESEPDTDHVLMMHSIEEEDPRLTQMICLNLHSGISSDISNFPNPYLGFAGLIKQIICVSLGSSSSIECIMRT